MADQTIEQESDQPEEQAGAAVAAPAESASAPGGRRRLRSVPSTPAPTTISRHIPEEQKRLLLVRAGGRCELCNK